MAYAPTLTPTIDANPCPRVLVQFTPRVARTNLCTNPNFETDVQGWFAENGAALTRDTVSPIAGIASAKLTGATAGGGDTYASVLVNAGDTVTFSLSYTTLGTITGTPKISLAMPGAAVASQALPLTQAAAGRFSVTATAVSSGTAYLSVAAGAALGDVLHFDNVLVEKAATALAYFDGSTVATSDSTYAWTGTPNESWSTQTVGLAAGTQTINVYRTAEGRQFKVRGGVNLYAVGGASVMDFEPPVGAAASYQAEQFTSSGASLGFTDASSVTIPGPSVFSDTSLAVIHQPLSPALSIIAPLNADTASDLVNVNPGAVFNPEGSTVGTWIGGQRQGISNMPFSMEAQSFADADKFRSMFGGYDSDFPAILCVRTAPPSRLPRVLFLAFDSIHESVDYVNSTVTFTMTGTEVAPPAPGLLLPTLRREDIDAAYATRAARAAAYATRLARDTDYSLAGLAG